MIFAYPARHKTFYPFVKLVIFRVNAIREVEFDSLLKQKPERHLHRGSFVPIEKDVIFRKLFREIANLLEEVIVPFGRANSKVTSEGCVENGFDLPRCFIEESAVERRFPVETPNLEHTSIRSHDGFRETFDLGLVVLNRSLKDHAVSKIRSALGHFSSTALIPPAKVLGVGRALFDVAIDSSVMTLSASGEYALLHAPPSACVMFTKSNAVSLAYFSAVASTIRSARTSFGTEPLGQAIGARPYDLNA